MCRYTTTAREKELIYEVCTESNAFMSISVLPVKASKWEREREREREKKGQKGKKKEKNTHTHTKYSSWCVLCFHQPTPLFHIISLV